MHAFVLVVYVLDLYERFIIDARKMNELRNLIDRAHYYTHV